MEAERKKSLEKHLKNALKWLVTLWALYYVFSSIDIRTLLQSIRRSDPLFLLGALLAFNASKLLSAVRLNRYFAAAGVYLSEYKNILLYYLGMFYNLFLPGGISGDGYKIYILSKRNSIGYKTLLQATILDRISGLAALLFLAGILFAQSSFSQIYENLKYPVWLGTVLVIPALYLLSKKLFPIFVDIFGISTILAFGVQLLQLLSAASIVYALPHTGASMADYLTLFLVSSVAAVLPISVGGVGVREFTLYYGFTLLGQDTANAVAFSLIFFLITALSSLLGAFVKNDF